MKDLSIMFEGVLNIAFKIPKSKYEQTVAFYRNILKLKMEVKPVVNKTVSRTHQVKFGFNTMCLEWVDNFTHSETWLKLSGDDVDGATKYLGSNGIQPCDEIEELPENMHWITDPAGMVFIVKKRG